jgi:hypothetical protein
MIGVVAKGVEPSTVAEFFELFKTPWEFWRPGIQYDVLLCCDGVIPENDARLILLYGSKQQAFEQYRGIQTQSIDGRELVCFDGEQMPIYGRCLLFEHQDSNVLFHNGTNLAAAFTMHSGDQTVVRLGFDLFNEVYHLLTKGQPAELGSIPTLELHISLLRELIVSHGIPLIEIPPIPAGHPFIVCLTHDVDHPGVRYHVCDHTMFGFLYRALIASLIDFCRGRKSLRQVVINWRAAFSLPLVFAGVVKDFWNQLDRYLELERDLASTFFVIPTKAEAGIDSHGRTNTKRASHYSLADIAEDLQKLISANREIAVHGINAWRDSSRGREEREHIQIATGATETGVRMHWLYFNAQTPTTLEKAGFSYDSTVGYNETIGYRAGTTQVFKQVGVDHLLELPLHIMDTALFYPSYMNLSEKNAATAMLALIEKTKRFGGVLTVNWHDRSLGPERLWGDVYVALLHQLRVRAPWFATAAQTVAWFRKRRETTFASVTKYDTGIQVQPSTDQTENDLPSLTVRVYNNGTLRDSSPQPGGPAAFEDFILGNEGPLLIAA